MRELTIRDLYDIYIDNIYKIILIVALGAIIGLLYTNYFVTPMYESSTKIILAIPSQYISNEEGQVSGGELTTNDITLNQKLVSTYSEIIKSRTVLNEVITTLNLNETAESVASNITVSPVKDSEVINIKVSNEDANIAANIANEVIVAFAKQVKEIYNIENVNQVDEAVVNNDAYNVSVTKSMALFAIIAFLIIYGICFAREYFKNTLRTPQDVEDLDLPILAMIPDLDGKEVE